jgi:hypothetical protein
MRLWSQISPDAIRKVRLTSQLSDSQARSPCRQGAGHRRHSPGPACIEFRELIQYEGLCLVSATPDKNLARTDSRLMVGAIKWTRSWLTSGAKGEPCNEELAGHWMCRVWPGGLLHAAGPRCGGRAPRRRSGLGRRRCGDRNVWRRPPGRRDRGGEWRRHRGGDRPARMPPLPPSRPLVRGVLLNQGAVAHAEPPA